MAAINEIDFEQFKKELEQSYQEEIDKIEPAKLEEIKPLFIQDNCCYRVRFEFLVDEDGDVSNANQIMISKIKSHFISVYGEDYACLLNPKHKLDIHLTVRINTSIPGKTKASLVMSYNYFSNMAVLLKKTII